jgi:hypothetical protein
MKTFGIVLLALAYVLVGHAETPRSALRTAISEVLKASFVYDESKASEDAVLQDADNITDRIALPQMVVTADRDDAASAISAARAKIEDEAFDWRNGGTILKKKGRRITSELKFSENPNGGFEFLKFSW